MFTSSSITVTRNRQRGVIGQDFVKPSVSKAIHSTAMYVLL